MDFSEVWTSQTAEIRTKDKGKPGHIFTLNYIQINSKYVWFSFVCVWINSCLVSDFFYPLLNTRMMFMCYVIGNYTIWGIPKPYGQIPGELEES